MTLLVKNARIVCPGSPFHQQVTDVLIRDGIIRSIGPQQDPAGATLLEHDNLHLSTGWVDLFAHYGDPGFEYRETLASGCSAAAAGGFTDVFLAPNTSPAVSTLTQIEYLLQRTAHTPVRIHPIATVTRQAVGQELSEMYDLARAGARAFSDGTSPLQSPGLIVKALQYLKPLRQTLIQIPLTADPVFRGLMHEGLESTRMGLPGIPAVAEELAIQRDIELLRYTQSRLHLTGISTANGLRRVLEARDAGLDISFSVTPYHAIFCDEDLAGYDTRLKVNPPLRTRQDRDAIRQVLEEGQADGIASHHTPLHTDEKDCEFETALFGMTGQETVFSALNRLLPDTDLLIEQLTRKPRETFGLPQPEIREGAEACLTFFDPAHPYTVASGHIRSRSQNNPWIGQTLTGRVIGTYNRQQLTLTNT